jgi:hypothetical protein
MNETFGRRSWDNTPLASAHAAPMMMMMMMMMMMKTADSQQQFEQRHP